jgi:hypothetical protein
MIMGKAMRSAAERRKSMSKAKKAMRTLFTIVEIVVGAVNGWCILRRGYCVVSGNHPFFVLTAGVYESKGIENDASTQTLYSTKLNKK